MESNATCVQDVEPSQQTPPQDEGEMPSTTNDATKLYMELPYTKILTTHLQENVSHCMRLINFSEQWLPLVPVSTKRDEGLLFPDYSERFRRLLELEIEKDNIVAPKTHENGLKVLDNCDDAGFDCTCLLPALPAEQSQEAETRIEPPLLPPPSPCLLFQPTGECTIIDLVSEAASSTEEKAEIFGETHTLETIPDLERIQDLFTAEYEPIMESRHIQNTKEDFMIEIPLISNTISSPVDNEIGNLTGNVDLLRTSTPGRINTEFKDNFSDIVHTSATKMRLRAEQEALEQCGGVSKQPVPLVDFNIPLPDWESHRNDSRSQLKSLIQSAIDDGFISPLLGSSCLSTKQLKWMPIPPGMGQIPVDDGQRDTIDIIQKQLTTNSKIDFNFEPGSSLTILEYQDDEKDEVVIEQIDFSDDDDIKEAIETEPCTIFQVPTKRQRNLESRSESDSMLSNYNDSTAASKLLANFMELQTSKRPRIETPQTQIQPNCGQNSSGTDSLKLSDVAVEPSFMPPTEKAAFFISVSLNRLVFREVQRLWGADYLIDIDYRQMTTNQTQANTNTRGRELISEADVSLSPSLGIIVTTFIEARQKSLPESETGTAFRSRLRKLQYMYSTIYVLVSEDHLSSNSTKGLNSSDMKAYADIVCFALSLEASVTCIYVPGPLSATATWIAALMCENSPTALPCRDLLSGRPTSWDLLLRRCGMNIFAAQVLCQTLYQKSGSHGLIEFLRMSAEQRIARYADVVGRFAIKNVSDTIDDGW